MLCKGRRMLCAAWVIHVAALSGAAAPAHAQPAQDVWVDELVLEVVKEPYRLSDGIIVLQEEQRFYVPLIELADLFDFMVQGDARAGTAAGWAVSEERRFSIDVPRGQLVVGGKVADLAPEDIMTGAEYAGAGEDIFVSLDVIARLWPVQMSVNFSTLRLSVETAELLPFEQKLEREGKRALLEARKKYAPTRNTDLPFVPNPYRLFSLPAVDIDTQVRWDQDTGSVTGQGSVRGVMDLAGLSTTFAAATDYADRAFSAPNNIRVTGTRKAYGGDDLVLGFKEFEIGDTRIQPRALVDGSIGGRGAVLSTRSLEALQEFDQITIEGPGKPGWETELYRNNELVDFGVVDALGEYRFENVQLMVGNNTIRVVMYGPQGQVEERSERHMITGSMTKPGSFDYEVGFVDAHRDFIPVDQDPRTQPRGLAGNVYGAYGVNSGLTVFGGASRIPVEDSEGGERNYVSAGAMFNVLDGLAQVEAYKNMTGGAAIDMRFVGEFMGVRLNAQHVTYSDFESPEAGYGDIAKRTETDVSLNRSVNTGLGALGLQVDVNHINRYNDMSTTTLGTRQSLGQGGVRVTNQTTTIMQDRQHDTTVGMISAHKRVRSVNLRGAIGYDVYPDMALTLLQADARYLAPDGFSAGINAQHDLPEALTRVGATVGYDFGKALASFDVNWIQESGLEFILRTSTALAPFGKDGRYIMSSDKLSAARPVRARVFLDHDMDGAFGAGDEPLPDARVQVGLRPSDDATDEAGTVVALYGGGRGGVTSVQVDKASLVDPYYMPGVEGFNTVPREGVVADIALPVIETGAIDGTVMRADGDPVGGMTLQLVDSAGAVAMTTETARDGYYTFEYVRAGDYTVRADPSYGVDMAPVAVTVTADEFFAYGMDMTLRETAVLYGPAEATSP